METVNHFIIRAGDRQEKIQIQLTEDEKTILLQYIVDVERLTRLVDSDLNVTMHFSMNVDNSPKFEATFPEEAKIITCLHLMRPFILQEESLYFHKVNNLFLRQISEPTAKAFFLEQKRQFSGEATKSIVQFKANDILVSSEEFFLKYLNAFEYHKDNDKRNFFEELFKFLPIPAARFFVVSLLIDKVRAVINLGGFISMFTGKTKELNYRG